MGTVAVVTRTTRLFDFQWSLWREEHAMRSAKGGGEGAVAMNAAELDSNWLALPDDVRGRSKEAFIASGAQPSRLQLAVRDALVELGMAPEEEVCTAEGYSIDLVVELGGRRVAIEVDGPSHYLGQTRLPTGASVAQLPQHMPQPRNAASKAALDCCRTRLAAPSSLLSALSSGRLCSRDATTPHVPAS